MRPVIEKYWKQLAPHHDASAFEVLQAGYGAPERGYHDWSHIAELLGNLDEMSALATRPALIAAAIFWHDSVYMTRGADGVARKDEENVGDSAKLFLRHSRFSAEDTAAIHDLIMATAGHASARAAQEYYPGFSRDLDLFLDLDLSPLGAPWDVFADNFNRIRHEFSWVPEDEFYQSRLRMLEVFRNCGDTLFRHAESRARWLEKTQDNLRRVETELLQPPVA